MLFVTFHKQGVEFLYKITEYLNLKTTNLWCNIGVGEVAAMYDIFVQSLGFLSMGLNFFIYIQKTRARVLIVKLICDSLTILQMLLLGAYSGMLVLIICIIRGIIFYNSVNHEWARKKFWLPLFVAVSLGTSVISWNGIISLLPSVGTALAIIGFGSASAKLTRLFNIPGNILWGIYHLIVGSLGGFGGSIVGVISAIIGLIKFDRKNAGIHKS